MKADELRVGDAFRWCGRTVVVKAAKPQPRKVNMNPHRGRYIVIDSPVESVPGELRLHYYDDERVDLLERSVCCGD